MLLLSITDPRVIGPVVASVVGLAGVILTIIFNKKSKAANKNIDTKQTSTFSRNTQNFQAGRDIKFNDKDEEKKE